MRKGKGKAFRHTVAALLLAASLPHPQRARAAEAAGRAETAVFHVQSAEAREDGTVSVSVYLTGTDRLGGLDAELAYDASKASYIGSGIGASFSDGYGETNHLAGEAKVKCVLIYPQAKAAHGELMHASFRLSGRESYQPELRVTDLLDGSDEIRPIPYRIAYQQADGSWADTPDTSAKRASSDIIEQAQGSYGAEGDTARSLGKAEEGERTAEERMEGSSQTQTGADGTDKAMGGRAGDTEEAGENAKGAENVKGTEENARGAESAKETEGNAGKEGRAMRGYMPLLLTGIAVAAISLSVTRRKNGAGGGRLPKRRARSGMEGDRKGEKR